MGGFWSSLSVWLAMILQIGCLKETGIALWLMLSSLVFSYWISTGLLRKSAVGGNAILLLRIIPNYWVPKAVDSSSSVSPIIDYLVPWKAFECMVMGAMCAVLASVLPWPSRASDQVRVQWCSLLKQIKKTLQLNIFAFELSAHVPLSAATAPDVVIGPTSAPTYSIPTNTPATDIAGLSQILHIRSANAVIELIRQFEDETAAVIAETRWEYVHPLDYFGLTSSSANVLELIRCDFTIMESLIFNLRGMSYALKHSSMSNDVAVHHSALVERLTPALTELSDTTARTLYQLESDPHSCAQPHRTVPTIQSLENVNKRLATAYLEARRDIWFNEPTSSSMSSHVPLTNDSKTRTVNDVLLNDDPTFGGCVRARSDLLILDFFLLNIRDFVDTLQSFDRSTARAPRAAPLLRSSQPNCWSAFRHFASYLYSAFIPPQWNRQRFKEAFKASLAITLASAFSLIPAFSSLIDRGFWAPLTVAFVRGENLGSTSQLTGLRLQGTVVGCLVGYLTSVLTGSNVESNDMPAYAPYLLAALMTVWVSGCTFIRSGAETSGLSHTSPIVGLVAGVSALIVTMARDNPSTDTVQSYALLRMINTFIGVSIAWLVNWLVFPTHASAMIEEKLISAITTAQQTVQSMFDAYNNDDDSKSPAEMKRMVNVLSLHAAVKEEIILLPHVIAEPELWSKPFPNRTFERVIHVQQRLVMLLKVMTQTVNRMSMAPVRYAFSPLSVTSVFLPRMYCMQHELIGALGLYAETLQKRIHQKNSPVQQHCPDPRVFTPTIQHDPKNASSASMSLTVLTPPEAALLTMQHTLRSMSREYHLWIDNVIKHAQMGLFRQTNGAGRPAEVDLQSSAPRVDNPEIQSEMRSQEGVLTVNSFLFGTRMLISEVLALGQVIGELLEADGEGCNS